MILNELSINNIKQLTTKLRATYKKISDIKYVVNESNSNVMFTITIKDFNIFIAIGMSVLSWSDKEIHELVSKRLEAEVIAYLKHDH